MATCTSTSLKALVESRLMFPLLAGLSGIVLGLATSPNPIVALICGGFLALVAWALTGFKVGGQSESECTPNTKSESGPKPSPETATPTSSVGNQAVVTVTPTDKAAERKWRNFKIKSFLVIAVVFVAANYERCTETPMERARKDALSVRRIQSISAESAYDECKADDGEQECREAARRAAELARDKAKIIYGQ